MVGRSGFLVLKVTHTDVMTERTLVTLRDCIEVIKILGWEKTAEESE